MNRHILIVGGGPAGLAAAIAASQRGFRVTVADCAEPPIDKPCGEGLMPDGLLALHELGIHAGPADSFPFRGIRFIGAGDRVEADFPAGCGLGVRRTALHRLLLERATQLGVSFLWKTKLTSLSANGAVLNCTAFGSDWVVGADGQNSLVRRWAGLDGSWLHSRRYAYRCHFRIKPWTDYMELYWGPGCQIYATPVGKQEVCVAVISRDSRLRLEQALPRFPELWSRLSGAEISSRERGAITSSRMLKRIFHGRITLIGDASGSIDAISGEGLCLAFRQALILAGALEPGGLSAYQSAHRRLAVRPLLMARLMLLLDRHPWLQPRVLRSLASDPPVFSRLLAMHVGSLSAPTFIRSGMLPLVFQTFRGFNPW